MKQKKLSSNEIRSRFLAFFEKRGHEIVPSASLVPENDPSVLFNTAGMQPLVPYLMGQKYPTGATRIANSQKCVRTGDIDEVGDNTHLTFFEMLGNWSLGDYFKKDAIYWSFELLTSQDEGFGLEPERLYVTVFEGDDNAPKDKEAYNAWKDVFERVGLDPDKRIFFMGAEENWWSPGDNGPCGPDSEMFYDVSGKLTDGLTKEEFISADDRQDVVEIWNDVFMEYEKKDGKVIGKLAQQNVDTGSGLERVVAVVQGKDNVFDTDLFMPIIEKIEELSNKKYNFEKGDLGYAEKPQCWLDDMSSMRVIADHLRAAVFLISDGVVPSNTDQGYVLRRLLRRSMMKTRGLGMRDAQLVELTEVIVDMYGHVYGNLNDCADRIYSTLQVEVQKFGKSIESGQRELSKLLKTKQVITGVDAFNLYQTHGYPLELTKEILGSMNKTSHNQILVDEHIFFEELKKHQDLSRTSAEGKFKGGLANSSEKTTALHTATHLMLAGLRKYLGDEVHQKGSNITEERTRFDFSHNEKVPREILDKVEEYVNEAIQKKCIVTTEQMNKEEAKKQGVEGSFWEKYPPVVNVYSVKCDDGTIYSQELCGGPHVENTREIEGVFKIKKEKASSAGVRRIKAVLDTVD